MQGLSLPDYSKYPRPEFPALLRARKWWIFGVTALTTAAAVAFSLQQTPIYEATAEVLVEAPMNGESSAAEQAPNMETERKLAKSVAVADLVGKELTLSQDAIDLVEDLEVDVPAETEILTFTYSRPEPGEAQRLAQAFAEAYLAYRSQQTLEDPQSATAAAIGEIRAGRVVQPAPFPDEPARPNHPVNATAGLALGLMLGVGTAVGRDYFDDRLRGRSDLEFYSGAHVLAVVPHERGKTAGRSMVVMGEQPDSPAAEAFRQLRTNILFASSKRDARTILITSAQPGEGKTSTTANLGVALARAGKKVILLSADLRKPRLHAFFDLPNDVGLTNVLSQEVAPLDALQRAGVENLRVLASGPIPGNPAELLESDDMRQLLIGLRPAAQFVLVDTAPLLPVADASTLVPYVDAVVFVADARRSTRTAVQHAAQRLNQVNAPVIGSIYNKVDLSKAAGYPAYGVKYGYGETNREETG